MRDLFFFFFCGEVCGNIFAAQISNLRVCQKTAAEISVAKVPVASQTGVGMFFFPRKIAKESQLLAILFCTPKSCKDF